MLQEGTTKTNLSVVKIVNFGNKIVKDGDFCNCDQVTLLWVKAQTTVCLEYLRLLFCGWYIKDIWIQVESSQKIIQWELMILWLDTTCGQLFSMWHMKFDH